MPTSRRRVVTHRNSSPPVAHCRSTVAASSRITSPSLPSVHLRTATALLAVLLATACSGGSKPGGTTPNAVQPDRETPPALLGFLRRVVRPGAEPFTATYEVLQ